ncbi:hypothetical protein M2351_006142 [Azospirillum canadense]|nr:hypothetical protein [Azospirillum canadense]
MSSAVGAADLAPLRSQMPTHSKRSSDLLRDQDLRGPECVARAPAMIRSTAPFKTVARPDVPMISKRWRPGRCAHTERHRRPATAPRAHRPRRRPRTLHPVSPSFSPRPIHVTTPHTPRNPALLTP